MAGLGDGVGGASAGFWLMTVTCVGVLCVRIGLQQVSRLAG